MSNREIKFRVWKKQTLVDTKYVLVKTPCIHNLVEMYKVLNDIFLNKLCVFQQFTGLKDENEKEIYEGDIVETIYADENHIGEIIFDNNTCAYRIKTKQNLLPIITYRFDENYNPKGFLQVVTLIVGNIFENSDLII